MSQVIGFVGLGRMGGHMSRRLMEAGHRLVVYDVAQAAMAPLVEKGAKAAASLAEVGREADIVFASLPTPAILQNAALAPDGLASGGRMKTFVDLSTSGPRTSAAVWKALGDNGVAALDAPVSGGVAGARDGKLTVMVSGPKAAFDAVQPILSTFGRLFFLGETAGAAQTMKLVNNLMAACAIAITSEGMAMGIKAGLDPKTMIDILNVSTGRNSATEDKWPRSVLPRTFDFGFATALSLKDVRLCLEEAEAMGVPMVVGSAVRQMLSITNNLYGPDSDFTAMAKVVEQWAGIEPEPVRKENA